MKIIEYLRGFCDANPDRLTLIFIGVLVIVCVIAEIRNHIKYHESLFF